MQCEILDWILGQKNEKTKDIKEKTHEFTVSL